MDCSLLVRLVQPHAGEPAGGLANEWVSVHGEGPRAGQRWDWRGRWVGERVQEALGSRAHPRRHFGDLCPGRQSQPLAQSRRGT